MPKIHVVDVPEFSGLVHCARNQDSVSVSEVRRGYITISSDSEMVFHRRVCGFKPAIWYTCLSGGFEGRVAEYGRETLRLESDVQA